MDIFTTQNIVLFGMAAVIIFLLVTAKALDQIADEMEAEKKKKTDQ